MPDVASELLDRVRAICMALPEAYEEPAWVGVRWRIRKRTFTDCTLAPLTLVMRARSGHDD